MCIPYKSQTNGVAERLVSTLKDWIAVQESVWDSPIQLIYRKGMKFGLEAEEKVGNYMQTDVEGEGVALVKGA